MQVLAIVARARGRADSEFGPYRVPEERRVWALVKSSVIRRMWSRADQPGAVLLLEVAGSSEAREAMASLPMARAGLVEIQLLELAPFIALENLFGPQESDETRSMRPDLLGAPLVQSK
jgi:hypothetical protein